jgi:hypothetical protein
MSLLLFFILFQFKNNYFNSEKSQVLYFFHVDPSVLFYLNIIPWNFTKTTLNFFKITF